MCSRTTRRGGTARACWASVKGTTSIRVLKRVSLLRVQPDHAERGYCPRVPGVRMPATYINHYAANGGAVVPQFGGWAAETDALAIKTLQANPLIPLNGPFW